MPLGEVLGANSAIKTYQTLSECWPGGVLAFLAPPGAFFQELSMIADSLPSVGNLQRLQPLGQPGESAAIYKHKDEYHREVSIDLSPSRRYVARGKVVSVRRVTVPEVSEL